MIGPNYPNQPPNLLEGCERAKLQYPPTHALAWSSGVWCHFAPSWSPSIGPKNVKFVVTPWWVTRLHRRVVELRHRVFTNMAPFRKIIWINTMNKKKSYQIWTGFRPQMAEVLVFRAGYENVCPSNLVPNAVSVDVWTDLDSTWGLTWVPSGDRHCIN